VLCSRGVGAVVNTWLPQRGGEPNDGCCNTATFFSYSRTAIAICESALQGVNWAQQPSFPQIQRGGGHRNIFQGQDAKLWSPRAATCPTNAWQYILGIRSINFGLPWGR